MGKIWLGITVTFLLAGTCPISAQNLNLQAKENFISTVDAVITQGEKDIFKDLAGYDERRYFEKIFWYKRDSDPNTAANPYRKTFFERRQIAVSQFGEAETSGAKTDRGRIFLLLGDPDDVTTKALPKTGLKAGREETWIYAKHNLSIRFTYDGRRPNFKMEDAARINPKLERIRNRQVLDRAEPYKLSPMLLTLPYLGFTKDVENLASEDRFEIDFNLSFGFFMGDRNRTDVQLGLTIHDASDKGMEIHLTAFDPYDVKVADLKKRIEPENGKLETFFVALEPDQYRVVLRLMDRDGRVSINRQTIDVPRLDPNRVGASSVLPAKNLAQVPLQGFLQPKRFVFDDMFFPISNHFKGFSGDRIYLMQHYYNFGYEPKITWYLNHKPIEAALEHDIVEKDVRRRVVSIPAETIRDGAHHIHSVYEDESGRRVVNPIVIDVGGDDGSGYLLSKAKESDKIELLHPSGDSAAGFDRVVIRPDDSLKVEAVYVYLNDKQLYTMAKPPWEVIVDQGLFSISGTNTVTVIVKTDQGYLRKTKTLTPLRADERIKTRLVQIYFNAYDEDLKFVSDLDFNDLTVTVDGAPTTPKEVKRVEEPITYCFMVDTSYSMKDSFRGNISALTKFIQSMRPEDRGYFVEFYNDYRQYLHPNSSKAVLEAVAENLTLQKPNPKYGDKLYAENETYLFDAVISAVHTLIQYSGRKVILLVSDGIGQEGRYNRNGMLSYARENDVVIYSLWLDNNPTLSQDERAFLQKERSKGEKFARAIGLTRFFAKKDAKHNYISAKVRNTSITEGMLKILSEESGGFHYRVFKTDRTLIKEYVRDIEEAVQNQFVMTLNMPISLKMQHVEIETTDPDLAIRNKSEVKVRKSNPLVD